MCFLNKIKNIKILFICILNNSRNVYKMLLILLYIYKRVAITYNENIKEKKNFIWKYQK